MNRVEGVASFLNLKLPQSGEDISSEDSKYLLVALESLLQNGEWLENRDLVESVVLKLNAIDPQGSKYGSKIAAIYWKIMGKGSLIYTGQSIVKVKISDEKTIEIPKNLLMAESEIFRDLLNKSTLQCLDLSELASQETLIHFLDFLCTGNMAFITDENAIELLLLTNQYGLTELSMKCVEHILAPKSQWVPNVNAVRKIPVAEKDLTRLFADAKANGITISKIGSGAPHMEMVDGSKEEQWECLKKIHNFLPITHLKLSERVNLDHLLLFSQQNSNIISLVLGKSPNIDDEYLEKLSRNLSNLNSFSIKSNKIKAIPPAICNHVEVLDCSGCPALTTITAPAATRLDCYRCPALTTITAPAATKLNCYSCPALTTITAPAATWLNCNGCPALTTITAPAATTLNCHSCPALTTITAPAATTLYCHSCPALTTITAPAATTLNCRSCPALTTITAPAATWLDCCDCPALTTITAPAATRLDCSSCPALTTITAPAATTLYCSGCPALTTITAPAATTLNCSSCPALTTITAPAATKLGCHSCPALTTITALAATELDCSYFPALTTITAPAATTLYCHSCPALTTITAPAATTLNCYGCPALTTETKTKLSNMVIRNIATNYFTNSAELIKHLAENSSNFGITTPIIFTQWWTELQQLNVPADFDSEEERLHCEQSINKLLEKLIQLANAEKSFLGIHLDWFKDLKPLDSLQQQVNRIGWLGGILTCGLVGGTPLADLDAIPSLIAIGNLADPFLLRGASRALLLLYDTDAFDQKEVWKSLNKGLPDHLLLLCLFFMQANIEATKIGELLKSLDVKYYKNTERLNPMIEMAYMLSKSSSVPVLDREKIVELILKAPEKGVGEKAKTFSSKIERFRDDQQTWVTACRDLLLFERGKELINIHSHQDLLQAHEKACQEIFAVKAELRHELITKFESKRFPNGLFTYAARLQTLPDKEKTLLTTLLGQFVNGHLEGKFPGNRYDLSANSHLTKVFKGNDDLFKRWKDPFEMELLSSKIKDMDEVISPYDTVKKLMKDAINNHHLGKDQDRLYPNLVEGVKAGEDEAIRAVSENVLKMSIDLAKTIKMAPQEEQSDLKEQQSYLEIEKYCLQALNPNAKLSTLVNNLKHLRDKLPDSLELKHDVEGMLKSLEHPKAERGKWTKVKSTDSWEDLLLMGTEVNNSCQRINGDVDLNKCLLAYILDGKNKLMIVPDSEGKIAARSVLRILWDAKKECPVLFMERIYTASLDPKLPKSIIEGCEALAKELGLTLVASPESYPQGHRYLGEVSALGGPAPFEYVDALAGIQRDGVFTIPRSNIIYSP